MTSPSGHPPAGQAAASEAAADAVDGNGSAALAAGAGNWAPGPPPGTAGNGSRGSASGAALGEAARASAIAAGTEREGRTGTAAAAAAAAEPRHYNAGPRWAWFLPSIIALAASLWGITTPSFWRDEAATIAAVGRPFGDLIAMLGNVDAVHSVYYILMWPLVHVFGPSELVLRLPSALAMSGAAAAVAAIGRRLVSPGVGLASGLLFAALPVVSRYGQEGRSYAIVMLVAVIASYMLVRVLQAEPGGTEGSSGWREWQRRRWLMAYSGSLALLGIVNIFGLLLIGGHAVTVMLQYRRHSGDHAVRRLMVGWVIAVAAGVIVASPLLVFGWMEHAQIAWIAVNSPQLSTLLQLTGSFFVTVAIVVVIGVAFVVGAEASKDWRRAHWSRRLAELSLPWLVVPPLALLAASLISPVYTSRYILICVPPIALLGGTAIAALGRIGAPIALAVIVAAGVPGIGGQLALRSPYGHYDDIRGIDQIVEAQKKPGDVVLYTNPNAESFSAAYPYGLGTLPSIAQQQAAIPSGTLAGTQLSLAAIKSRLAHVSRVWIVEINKCVSPPQLLQLNGTSMGPALQGLPLHFVTYWHDHGDWLLLYAHGAGSQLVQPQLACPPTTAPATS
jgi:mannosyltransferase